MKTLKQKLEKAIGYVLSTKGQEKDGGVSDITDMIWNLFDVEHRDALRQDIQALTVEPEKVTKKADLD